MKKLLLLLSLVSCSCFASGYTYYSDGSWSQSNGNGYTYYSDGSWSQAY